MRLTFPATLMVAFAVMATAPLHADGESLSRPPTSLSTGFRFTEQTGEALFASSCQGCHMPDGRGATGAGTYPALAGNAHLASAQFTATTVALGRHNMPHFAAQPELGGFEAFVTLHLDDRQIAAVVNYVRSHFGNHYTDEVTPADIAALHR